MCRPRFFHTLTPSSNKPTLKGRWGLSTATRIPTSESDPQWPGCRAAGVAYLLSGGFEMLLYFFACRSAISPTSSRQRLTNPTIPIPIQLMCIPAFQTLALVITSLRLSLCLEIGAVIPVPRAVTPGPRCHWLLCSGACGFLLVKKMIICEE